MAPPAFLCVGMPKCGTSTLHRMLAEHPALFLPPIKEIKYFAYDHIGYRGEWGALLRGRHWAAKQEWQGLARCLREVATGKVPPRRLGWFRHYFRQPRDFDWYQSLFPDDRLGGDISPIYHVLDRDQIARIHALLPELRIIIMLRSPAEQIWSHCRMVVLRLQKTDALEAFRAHVATTTRMRPTYRGLVEDWRSRFGDRVLIGDLEELTAAPADFLARVTGFLGIEGSDEGRAGQKVSGKRVNIGLQKDVPAALRPLLYEHAARRLEGFEAIDAQRAAAWWEDLATFRLAAAA